MVPGTIVGALGYAEMKDRGSDLRKYIVYLKKFGQNYAEYTGWTWEGGGRG